MTKMKPIETQARTKPGPKPKPDAEKVVKKTVSLQPQTYEGLVHLGNGVLSRGIELLYESTAKRRGTRSA